MIVDIINGFFNIGEHHVFTNNFNCRLMSVHKANHDIQVVIDQYAVAQYVIGYLTKSESGLSQLLKAVKPILIVNCL